MKKIFAACSLAAIAVFYPGPASNAESLSISSTSIPIITRNLRLRSVGQEVVTLQKFLLNNQLLSVPAPTGYYGALTERAVRTWQSGHGIPPTGTVGPITRTAIVISAIAAVAPTITISAPSTESQPVLGDATTSDQSVIAAAVPTASLSVSSVSSAAGSSAGGHNNPPPVVVDYPTVTQTSPADGSTGAAYDRGFKVVFSHGMDSTTFNPSSFQVTAGGATVNGAIVYHPLQKTAVFYPYANLGSNTKISVTLSQAIKDSSDVALQNPYSFSFTTGSSATIGSSMALGSASTFGIVASTLANTDPTTITGDAAALAASNGMPGTITGASHLADSAASTAQADADSAAIDADLYACSSISGAADIGSQTFGAGTYCYTGPVTVTGTTTLSGSGDHIFKFQSTFTMNAGSNVAVVNGANPNSAYWYSLGTTTLGTLSHTLGTVISAGPVTTATSSRVDGHIFAQNSTATVASTTAAVPGSVYCTTEVPVHRRTMTAFQTHSGGNPTAAYVATDGTTVTGTINAQSCDFGVYVPPNATVVIQNATIHDANQAGVFNDGALVTVATSTIYNIGDHVNEGVNGGAFSLSGTQTGFGIYVATSSTSTISGNTIYNYQKAGILARVFSTVTIRNNVVTGAGTTTALAQIGIQLGFPDTVVSSTTIGNLTGNTVTGNIYGPSPDSVGILGALIAGENANALMATATSTNTVTGNQSGQDVVFQ